jgi:hypothetical protein
MIAFVMLMQFRRIYEFRAQNRDSEHHIGLTPPQNLDHQGCVFLGGCTPLSYLPHTRAGDMFAAWVAHDLLYLRQLWTYLSRQMTGYSTRYAGEW